MYTYAMRRRERDLRVDERSYDLVDEKGGVLPEGI
jgi:hypothetical protein